MDFTAYTVLRPPTASSVDNPRARSTIGSLPLLPAIFVTNIHLLEPFGKIISGNRDLVPARDFTTLFEMLLRNPLHGACVTQVLSLLS